MIDAINEVTTYKTLTLEKLNKVLDDLLIVKKPIDEPTIVLYTGFIGAITYNYAMKGLTYINAPSIRFNGAKHGKKHYRVIPRPIPHVKIDVFTLGNAGSIFKVHVVNNEFVYYKGTVIIHKSLELTPSIVDRVLNSHK